MCFVCFSERVTCTAASATSQRPDFICSHLFSELHFAFYGENQNAIDGSISRECMILSISTSTHSTSKQSDCTLSLGLHPSGHQHPDNIAIALRLCDRHSCNVLSTLRSCLDWLGLNFFVYIRI